MEPTEAMQEAARNVSDSYPYKPQPDGEKLGYLQVGLIWKAMLAAAQQEGEQPTAAKYTDKQLREFWLLRGGTLHAQNIETGSMPESLLLPLLNELITLQRSEAAQELPAAATVSQPFECREISVGVGSTSPAHSNSAQSSGLPTQCIHSECRMSERCVLAPCAMFVKQPSCHPTQQMKVGGKYNWKQSPQDQLIYIGKRGYWHQFKKIGDPREVWCEVADDELDMIEETTQQPTDAERLADELRSHIGYLNLSGSQYAKYVIPTKLLNEIYQALRAKGK